MEFDTWVPYVRDNVPRPVLLGLSAVALAIGFTYGRSQMLSAAFYLSLLVMLNAVIWKMESWTAARDRAAVAANVPTRGWGIDPSKPLLDRFRVDEEVRRAEPAS